MKTEYKNWVPFGLLLALYIGFGASFIGTVVSLVVGIVTGKTAPYVFFSICLMLALLCGTFAVQFTHMYRVYSYEGERKLMKAITEGVAGSVELKEGEKALDIGTGSGAVAIALAKNNPQGEVVGLDRWGNRFLGYDKALCEENAKAENVANVSFVQGDAQKLPFEDESFDVVVSNYAFHTIPGQERQAHLLEALRVLKKGGRFAIHDTFSKLRFGEMDEFLVKLKEMGFENVEFVDTASGLFMAKEEAACLFLSESKLLKGTK